MTKKRDEAAINHVKLAMDMIENDPEDPIAVAMRARIGLETPTGQPIEKPT